MPHQKIVVVVDNSNVFIEGQKVSAKKKGVFKNTFGKDTQDPTWRVDFGNLLTEISHGRMVNHAILVGSRPPLNDSVWKAAESSGFIVTVHDRNSSGKEKAVDTELVCQATEYIVSAGESMDLAIVSGDRDFIPLVNVAHRRKWEVEMWAWINSFKEDGEMVKTVDRVKMLDDVFPKIGRSSNDWP